jgi:hypothetical protein
MVAVFFNQQRTNFNSFGSRERLRVADVYQRADLYWDWGTGLRRRTSELDVKARNAHLARAVVKTAPGHADLEGGYR